ncbi:MAG: hypothetical protein Q4E99_03855, partial [Bacillota bacterium]|nr:hypothetical protein [Bacillota bacterium]
PNYNTYLLNGNYDLNKISADSGKGSIYWANASELLPAKDSKTIELSKIQEMSAYIVPYDKNSEYPGATAIVEGGETHYYYANINDALNAAKEYPLTFDKAIVNGKLSNNIPTDRVVFTKDKGDSIGELGWIGESGQQGIGVYGGFRKGIIVDLNGHSSGMVCPGLIAKDKVLIITSSSNKGSVGADGCALDDEGGTGYCSGNIIFNNVKLNGTVWVASHNIKLLNCDTTNVNYDGVTLAGKVYSNASGSLKLVAGAELKDATRNMEAYITPYKTGVGISYLSLNDTFPCMVDGEVRYYYTTVGKALTMAKSYPLKLSDVLDGTELKKNIPADKVTLVKDVGSLNYSYEGIAKSVVVDLNGHSATDVVPNQIDNGILVITSSSKMAELTSPGYAIDDYRGRNDDGGIIVVNNIKSSGRVSVANHEIYLVNGDYMNMRFDDIKSKGKVYTDETGKLDSISNNPQRALDDKCAYITPYQEDASYPNGTRYEKDGKVYYYYATIEAALNDAIEYPFSMEDVIVGGKLADNIPADKVTFLCSYNSTIGTCGVNGNDGRGGYLAPLVSRLGNSYGFRKGIVIDLNGFNAIGVCPGPISADSALIITSSAGRSTLSSAGDVFDDESGTGYCSGTVVLNNLKTTGKYWVANHALYLLDGEYNHNFDGLMPDGGAVFTDENGKLEQILPVVSSTASVLGYPNFVIIIACTVVAIAAVFIAVRYKTRTK